MEETSPNQEAEVSNERSATFYLHHPCSLLQKFLGTFFKCTTKKNMIKRILELNMAKQEVNMKIAEADQLLAREMVHRLIN
ncbi:hypothetical protein MTR_6g038180 [Medicago truncatula]|uniref:Uncharacterized protein n=1 Tax=Medicago truncatula TaxID=3880 RepID=A0A072U984_MEDTR|nr:hypothetical protein MTR_6g038180 [Medicago truncatula]